MTNIERAEASRSSGLFCGPLAALILVSGISLLLCLVPGYDPVRQSVSEIGERDSPARLPFAVMLVAVAACTAIFALSLRNKAAGLRRSTAAAYLVAAMAISATGVGLLAFPHPLHNVFGLSELIGYQAPWVLALTWRGGLGSALRRGAHSLDSLQPPAS